MKRLFSNYATTILGICAFVLGGMLLYKGMIDATGFGLIAGYGLIFLRSKDSLIGLPPAE